MVARASASLCYDGRPMNARMMLALFVPMLMACKEPEPLPPPPRPADAPPLPGEAQPPPGDAQAGQTPPAGSAQPPGAVCSLDDPKSCPAGKTCYVPPGLPTRTGNCQ